MIDASTIALGMVLKIVNYLLLFHELGVGAIVDHILSEDRGSEDGIDILCTNILHLAVQDKVVASGAKVYSGFLSEEYESEDIAILLQGATMLVLAA